VTSRADTPVPSALRVNSTAHTPVRLLLEARVAKQNKKATGGRVLKR
jgi:hypothetical protein